MATAAAGLVFQAGQAKKRVELRGSYVDYLITSSDSKGCSLFKFDVAPGFDTGAHYHTKIEEFFYVVEGELDLRSGDRTVHASAGTFVFVPPGVPHSIANPGSRRSSLLLGCSPPGHENYFDELADLLANPGPPDTKTVAALREKYDTIQLSSLQSK
jgi:mannose-6-phosphate isomerase-like protein (cupin superfamily)